MRGISLHMQTIMTHENRQSYFNNHALTDRWPFSIYHRGIENAVVRATSSMSGNARCLNVGCGFFSSYPRLKHLGKWEACDIDQGCVDTVGAQFPEIVCRRCTDLPQYPAGSFDFVMSTEVIEHITDPIPWVHQLLSFIKPGGLLIISTPNYGWPYLIPIVEYTVLEIIALTRGFSRFGIHPNKYSREKLFRHLTRSSPPGAAISVRPCNLWMALIGAVRIA